MEFSFFVLLITLLVIAILPPFLSYLGYHFAKFQQWQSSFVAFAIGVLLGTAVFQLLPEALHHRHGRTEFMIFMLILLAFFGFWLLEKGIHVWHHKRSYPADSHPQSFTTMLLLGDALHNVMDGLLLGASFLTGIPVGLQSALAIFIHELPQEFAAYSGLLYGGYERKKALKVKILTACTLLPSGVITFLVGGHFFHALEVLMLPLMTGIFLYLALCTLLPSVYKELRTSQHKTLFSVLSFMIGMAVVLLVGVFGFEHTHAH